MRSTPATGRIEDQTGRNNLELQNEWLTPNQLSDVSSTTPGVGDRLHIHYTVTPPKDSEDKVISVTLSGFATGSIVQGPSGQMTAAPGASTVTLTGGSLSGSVTATLPSTASNKNLVLSVVTEGPDGQRKATLSKQAITMDARNP